jgi:hypothetical protein
MGGSLVKKWGGFGGDQSSGVAEKWLPGCDVEESKS